MAKIFIRGLILICSVALLSGCATSYQKSGLSGGFSQDQLKDDIWRVRYGGNGFTSYETVQTYWLYNCAELALEKGYKGFEILSDLRLTMEIPVEAIETQSPWEKVHTVYTPIYVPGGGSAHPEITADIRLLRGEVQDSPPKRYNAGALKKRLEPLVNGKKCDNGNVCPHVHDYVYGVQPAQS